MDITQAMELSTIMTCVWVEIWGVTYVGELKEGVQSI